MQVEMGEKKKDISAKSDHYINFIFLLKKTLSAAGAKPLTDIAAIQLKVTYARDDQELFWPICL